ncbi:MAG TPA: FAD-binding oxidoreductase [Acidimicrobiales bacterium]|nr:FAD-binding oxidoreductase [Acidimicrobiales bacterium]
MSTETVDVAGLDGGLVTVSSEDLRALASRMESPLLRPGDSGWGDAVLIWNGMAAKIPAAVLQPGSAAGVAEAVRFAAERRLLLSIKGGGHNIAGTSMASDGLTLDMSHMRQIDVDAAGRRAHVGAGCLIADVDAATQEHGLAAVLGFVSLTGVAGLTLGGGFGYLTRRFGWTIDNLDEVEIVTADGEIRTANSTENAELFWALRGGGGNFGVVTRFTFRLHEVGPQVTGGLILWDGARAEEVQHAYRDLTASAPRELTAVFTIRLAPPAPFVPQEWHGKPIVGMAVCYSGADAPTDLAPIRALGDPIVDLITEKPYVAQQSMLDATQPKGAHYYWKTEFVPELSDGYQEAFRAAALKVTSPMSQSIAFHLGGALNERADDDGAMGNREARFVTGFAGAWPAADPRGPEHVAWVRESWETIRPFSTGNYVNFQVVDDDTDRTAAAYGANFARLQRVKADVDPDNLFRVNRNIVQPTG